MPLAKLTKTVIDKIPNPDKGQIFYRDTELKGFGIRIGMSDKAYYAEKRVNGKTVRVTIGKHGQITTEQARKEAQKLLAQMTDGRNPVEEKREDKLKGITLLEAYEDYVKVKKSLKDTTRYDYAKFMRNYFSDWHNKPLGTITKNMVLNRHEEIGRRSETQANIAMRFLRALFYFSIEKYEDANGKSVISDNPVKIISKVNAWYRIKKRTGIIKPNELPAFFKGLKHVQDTSLSNKTDIAIDYLILLLLTGLRKTEGASIKWEQVDFENRSLAIGETKNHDPLILPLSDFLFDLLKKRYEVSEGEYVFPGEGENGFIVEPRTQIARIKEFSGLQFALHDLRRTFITIAESLDISAYAVKRLVNHRLGGDVTEGYIIQNVERLRKPMQQITDYILDKAGIRKNGIDN